MMRALYLSHTGMSEPLGRSQVVPYVRGLARAGWRIDVVAFEPASATASEIARVTNELAGDGIGYHWARRSPAHGLATKLAESAQALWQLVRRAAAGRPRVVHARSYLPGAVAQLLAELVPGVRFLFDCRGLLGDEYVDYGHWSRDDYRYRLLKRFERRMFRGADAVVTLTDRLRRWLVDEALVKSPERVEVIPCCVDLDRFRADEGARRESRARLHAGERFVLAYAGNLGSWYAERELAQLFARLRRRRPALLAVFTRAASDRLRAALRSEQVPDEDVRIEALPPEQVPAALAGADAANAMAQAGFSKIASSPVKIAEYLAMGLPVVVNRGLGDTDELFSEGVLVDAGRLSADDLDRAADSLAALRSTEASRAHARAVAVSRFDLQQVGVARYLRVYERLASGRA